MTYESDDYIVRGQIKIHLLCCIKNNNKIEGAGQK